MERRSFFGVVCAPLLAFFIQNSKAKQAHSDQNNPWSPPHPGYVRSVKNSLQQRLIRGGDKITHVAIIHNDNSRLPWHTYLNGKKCSEHADLRCASAFRKIALNLGEST